MQAAYKIELTQTLKLAIPIIVAQVGVVLMGITDTMMIGSMLGKTALGVAGISNSLAFLIASIAVGGLHVVSPLISKAKAEQDEEEIYYLYKGMMSVVFGLGIVLTILVGVIAWYFDWLEQPVAVAIDAPLFLFILAISHFANYYFLGIKQVLDGLSKPGVAMNITIAGLACNILFNYLLMKGFLFIPALGAVGAAYSTLFTRILMGFIIWYYLKKKSDNVYLADANEISLDLLRLKKIVIKLYKLVIPSGLALFFEVGAFTFTFIMMGWLGETQMAAHQVALNFVSAAYMVAAGISYASGIRVGDGRGRKDLQQIRRAGNVCFMLISIFMALSSVFIILFDKPIIQMYIHEPEVIEVAVSLLWIGGILAIFDGLQVGGLSVLRGLSDVNIPTAFTLFAYWVIALPLGYYLGIHAGLGAEGIYYGLYAGLACASILVVTRFYLLIKSAAILKG